MEIRGGTLIKKRVGWWCRKCKTNIDTKTQNCDCWCNYQKHRNKIKKNWLPACVEIIKRDK